MDAILKKRFQVRYLDIDFEGKLKTEFLLNYLMDSAAEHATKLGVGVVDLFKLNLTWILSRWHIRISRYPRADETISITTWPSTREGRFTMREFDVVDSKGGSIKATTSWLAVNLQSKRPVRLESFLPDFPLRTDRAIADDFPPLPGVEKAELELEFPVLRRDLDLNRHVNSTIYINWALETVPEEVLFKLRPTEIEINYRAEAFYGDRILSRTQMVVAGESPQFVHEIVRAEDGKELALLKTAWRAL
jgi:acyl-ACP thioesterase